MIIYRFIVCAERERFMESPLRESLEYFIAADSYDQAHSYVWEMLRKAGWKIKKITGQKIILQDIRNACNYTKQETPQEAKPT